MLHEYQLVYITKGRGTFASDTTPSVDISKGQILFLFPGQWHTYAPLQKTGWNEYYIGFEGPIIDNLVKNSFISKENQILDIGINEELASLFARALEVAEADKTYLGIKKHYEPLLLVPIAFGVLIANFPGGEMGVIQACLLYTSRCV